MLHDNSTLVLVVMTISVIIAIIMTVAACMLWIALRKKQVTLNELANGLDDKEFLKTKLVDKLPHLLQHQKILIQTEFYSIQKVKND